MTTSAALLLGDARLPTGGHTQSAGLEPALSAGLAPDAVRDFILTRLRTTVRVDAATAVVGLHHLDAGMPLDPVVDAWCARTPSDVTRAASVEAGRGYLRLRRHLGDRSVQPERLPRPLAVAVVARALGVGADELARVICHDDVQTVCSAALKLVPCDPATTVAWAVEVGDEVDRVVTETHELHDPADIPAVSAPAMELWQHAHGTATRRLFRA